MSELTHSRPYDIVVGLDFSDLSRRALEEALGLASFHSPSELHVITVAEHDGALLHLPGHADPVDEAQARELTRARVATIVDEHHAAHGTAGLERIAVYVVTGDPAQMTCLLASELDAALIVVGTHGRKGLSRLMLGSVAADVVRDAPCGVYVVRPPDFVHGKKVPEIEPPLRDGQPHLKHFEERRTYHVLGGPGGRSVRPLPAS
jgi:nucleotide-binding universal stress UspA family protein